MVSGLGFGYIPMISGMVWKVGKLSSVISNKRRVVKLFHSTRDLPQSLCQKVGRIPESLHTFTQQDRYSLVHF